MSLPVRFFGDDTQRQRLERMCDEGVVHALMLVVPDGCARNDIARAAAYEYLKNNKKLIDEGTHPDCIVVAGEGKSGQIKTAAVGAALLEMNSGSALSDRRVLIIENIRDLNNFSCAKLLKTLEEPPRGVMLILTSDGIDAVPSTITSRCVCMAIKTPDESAVRALFSGSDRDALDMCITVFGAKQEYIGEALADKTRLAAVKKARDFVDSCIAKDELDVLTALSTTSSDDRPALLRLVADARCMAERVLIQTGKNVRLAEALAQLGDDLSRYVSAPAAAARFAIKLTTER